MHYSKPESLVSTEWLEQHLDDPEIAVIDASWYLPAQRRDPIADFQIKHIPGATFFDIEDLSDQFNPAPHMIPRPDDFALKVGALGIGNGLRIIAYDSGSMMASCRAWWMFRLFGYDDVAVLSGGFSKWQKEKRQIETGAVEVFPRTFTVNLRQELLRTQEQMRQNIDSKDEQVLDARSRERFHAKEPEPRIGLRGGHIPGSICLPYPNILTPEGSEILPPRELKEALEKSAVSLSKSCITTCGSGVSACILALGLHLLGHENYSVYDGSWAEWGGQS